MCPINFYVLQLDEINSLSYIFIMYPCQRFVFDSTFIAINYTLHDYRKKTGQVRVPKVSLPNDMIVGQQEVKCLSKF